VAGKLLATVGSHAFLRRHPPPLAAGLQEVKCIAEACGVAFDTTDARSLQESLNRLTSTADPRVVQVVTALLMTPMKAAVYLVAGSTSSDGWAHYALNIPYYTHFTSPIRRYADVCVHRLLDLSLTGDSTSLTTKDLGDLQAKAEHCNEMKENAQKAQRRSDVVFLAVHLRDAPLRERGVVIGLGEKSFTVLVPSLGIQERLMVDEMPGVVAELDPLDTPISSKRLVLTRRLTDPATGKAPVAANTTRNTPNTLSFVGALELRIMTEVLVSVSTKMSPPPVDVCVTLVGPWPSQEEGKEDRC
jgi:exoribonuclease R